jgi:hypothetical protein
MFAVAPAHGRVCKSSGAGPMIEIEAVDQIIGILVTLRSGIVICDNI